MDADRLAEAQNAAEMPFTMENTTVEKERRPAKVVYSARIPAEYSDDIAAEAAHNGQNPSQLIATLVVEALAARRQTAKLVTVDLAVLHRAIDAAALNTQAA